MKEILATISGKPHATLVLAHGAGMPMDAPFMNDISDAFAEHGLNVIRFAFAYMAAQRDGQGKPPRLMKEFVDVLSEVQSDIPVFVGGKSMGGWVASRIAEEQFRQGRKAGFDQNRAS